MNQVAATKGKTYRVNFAGMPAWPGSEDDSKKKAAAGLKAKEREGYGLPAEEIQLTRIAELILFTDARSIPPIGSNVTQEELRAKMRERLAIQLGCTVADISTIVDSYGEHWEGLVLERRVAMGIQSQIVREQSWDKVESLSLAKIIFLLEHDRVSSINELLAVARAANQATRKTGVPPPPAPAGGNVGMSTHIHINGLEGGYSPGDPDNGVLPSGNLGTIRMSLSHRVQGQLAKASASPDEIQDRVIDSVEMLDLKTVQKLEESTLVPSSNPG